MDRAKTKDDSKAMNRLFKLAVIGSALIVTVYSVYYYSNAYKHSSTNIYYVEEEADIVVKSSWEGLTIGTENTLVSSNQEAALQNSHGTWTLVNDRTNATHLLQNDRTTVAMCGVVAENFDKVYTEQMIMKFQNIPPVLMDIEKDGIVAKSIQFEHFMFPVNAMINWRDDSRGYKVFNFEAASMPGEIEFFKNGFEWHSGKEEFITVMNCDEGDDIEQLWNLREAGGNVDRIQMPIVDFDILGQYPEHIGLEFRGQHSDEPKQVIQSEGELKILIGPSLKQNNVYEIDNDGEKLEIKPPFVVFLTKENADKPYFFGAFSNEKLLLH